MTSSVRSDRAIRTWGDWEKAKEDKTCTEAEQRLVEACLVGKDCTLGNGERPRIPTDENRIGADLLRYLISGGCEASSLDTWGVVVSGAYIEGELDLWLVRAVGVTGMINCHFEKLIHAKSVRLEVLNLNGSHCPGFDAQGAEVNGGVFLRNEFYSTGEVTLSGAVIGGQLNCNEGRFENTNGYALNAEGVKVKGNVYLGNGFSSQGYVSLSGAEIGGQLACIDGRFQNANGASLNAQGAEVKGDVYLSNGFSSQGEVSLHGAVIGGQLSCTDGRFENADGLALNAQGADVKGDVFLRNGFRSQGEVSLSGSVIGGQLACVDGRFENANGHALNAQGAEVKGDVFFRNGFSSRGEVSLSGALIGGQLDCNEGRFENTNGYALNAQGAEVKGGVFLRNGFSSTGEVRLSGSVIGGQLACVDGRFENANGDALNAQGAEVKGDVFVSNGFSSRGEVRLSGAVIGGQLSCSKGRFVNENGYAVNAQNAQMSAFFWKSVKACKGRLNLAGARANNLSDDAKSWALVNRSYLDGFRYETIHGRLDAPSRLAWLATARAHDGSFSPQPYEQLAKVLKEMGQAEQRRIILIEKEQRLGIKVQGTLREKIQIVHECSTANRHDDPATQETLRKYLDRVSKENKTYADNINQRCKLFLQSWPKQAEEAGAHPSEIALAQAGFRQTILSENLRIRCKIAWLQIKDQSLRWVVGYGYRPGNAVRALFLLIGVGWGVASIAYQEGQFAPNSAVILSTKDWQRIAAGDSDNPAEEWSETTVTGRDYESFSAFAYAIDVVIPVVAIGQEAAWAPSKTRGVWGHTLWWLRWVLTGAGWIVTALGAAAITGLIRRD